MIKRKVIELQAQSYIEEQFIMSKFPDAVWTSGVRGQFATFYIPESKEKLVEKCIIDFREKNS